MRKIYITFLVNAATITRIIYHTGDPCEALSAAMDKIELQFGQVEFLDYEMH